MNRRAAFEVVDRFEEALCEYTGAPFCVTTDSCTNALFLALRWSLNQGGWGSSPRVEIPERTYMGVVQAARNAGWRISYRDRKWSGDYWLDPTWVVDSAKRFERGMYRPQTFTCVSFQAAKLLPIGRGGAILHDNPDADVWLRAARLDGRTAGVDYQHNTYQSDGWHMYMTPPDAARGLWLLTYIDDDDQADWTEYPDLAAATWV